MDRLTQDAGFGIVPKQIMKNNKLSISSKGLYSYLCVYAGNKDTAFPSISLITYELNISKDTFYKYMNELKDNKYIVTSQIREQGKFSHTIYHLPPCPNSSDTVISDAESSDTTNVDTKSNSLKKNSLKKNNIEIPFESIKEIRNKYQGTKCKKDADNKLPKLIKTYGKEQLIRGIDRYIKFVEAERLNGFPTLKFKNESTYWNGGYMDYLDENFKTETTTSKRYSDFGEAY